MDSRNIRTCILDLLRLVKTRNAQLRRRCNNNWCTELRYLPENSLITRLKYVLWWAPLRALVTAYNRGLFRGYRVLLCVFEELQRRNLETIPCTRNLINEINGKLCSVAGVHLF